MTEQPDHSRPRLSWWFWLLPDIVLGAPLIVALSGGAAAVYLLRSQRVISGLLMMLAWLVCLVSGIVFLTRRKYASISFALALALTGLALAVGASLLP